jgi:hypothetical protein
VALYPDVAPFTVNRAPPVVRGFLFGGATEPTVRKDMSSAKRESHELERMPLVLRWAHGRVSIRTRQSAYLHKVRFCRGEIARSK